MSRNPDTIANNPELLERVAGIIETTTKKELLPDFVQWEIVKHLGFDEKYQLPYSKGKSVTYWQEKGGNQGYADLVLVTKVYPRVADKFKSAFEPDYAQSIDPKGADYLKDQQEDYSALNAYIDWEKAKISTAWGYLTGVYNAGEKVIEYVKLHPKQIAIGIGLLAVAYLFAPKINLNLKRS